jgi:hypothetical protein
MSRLLAKLISNPSMFGKDVFGNTMRDMVANANVDGYATLHNIVHPNLIEKTVEPVTPYQCNVVTLDAHVRNITNHLEKEGLRGRRYTKYESMMMVLESLHGLCKE